MGIFFTLLYIFTTYLAPATLFGSLAEYHIEQVIAALAVIGSCFGARGSGLLKMPQTYGVFAMIGCVAFSLAFNGVGRSIPEMVLGFMTSSMVFFFVLWNFRTVFHLRLLVATLLLAALVTVYQGATAVYHDDTLSPWVYMMGYEGAKFSRIRGMGFLNDPNDLSQLLVGLIPCVFFFWRRGQFLLNILFVLLPVSALGYGMFLTHSRGGMIGLLVALIVAGRRKFGILPAVLTGGALFVVLSAIGWSGGREISAESGSDRMEAWATGLRLIRTHPFFGVGYMRFAEFFPITAHNTIVVCAAEIGLVGLAAWMLVVVPTLYDLAVTARAPVAASDTDTDTHADTAKQMEPAHLWGKAASLKMRSAPMLQMAFATPRTHAGTQGAIAAPSSTIRSAGGMPFLQDPETSSPSDEEIRRLCGLMIASLSGFFAAGWFVSRSYTMVLFVNIALSIAVHRLAVDRGIAPPRLSLSKAMKYAGIAAIAMVIAVHILLRVTNLLPK